MPGHTTVVLMLVLCIGHLIQSQGVDLTLVAEANGTAVVQACIAKITQAAIFTSDNQLLRRIAYVETNDGLDANTYTANNSGGIWQLSESKYLSTKWSTSLQQQIQEISTSFSIVWVNTQWQDLRKPLYSALAARLYFYLISASIPLANNITGQGNYWVNYYTSSGETAAEFTNAVNQLSTMEDCSVSGLDLFFVMDESGSVGSSNFELMKDFVYDISNSFDIGPDTVRIGVQTYGVGYTFEFYLNTYSNKADVLNAIDNIVFNSDGATRTAEALNAIQNYAYNTTNGARPLSQGIPRITVVITDGLSENTTATASAAQQLHNDGIIVFAVGIANANTNELNAIASAPTYVSFISSFDANLLSNLQMIISNEACVASPKIQIDENVTSTVAAGETKYVNYGLPAGNEGITIQLNVSDGSTAVLYASTIVQTPNEAIHDVKVVSDGWGDAYIDPSQLSSNGGNTVYVAVVGLTNNTELTISVDVGDTSTVPVQVTPLPTKISRNYGMDLTVTCNATGSPVPTLSWFKDGSNLQTVQGITVIITTLDNTVYSVLLITSLKYEHEGMYTCLASNVLPNGTLTHTSSFALDVDGIVAQNIYGSALSATSIYLSWDEPPTPNITINHYILSVDELESVRFWTLYVVETHATVLSLHPYYTYSCRVSVFTDIMQVYSQPITIVTLQAAPSGPPLNPATQILDSRTIIVNWYPPAVEHQNGIIQYYIINYTEVNTGNKSQFTSLYPWLFLSSLHPYYMYTFAFAAVTIAKGPFSTKYSITTPEDAPSAPPVGYYGIAIDSTSIFISWQPPPIDQQNGIIREYHINITEIETGIGFSVASGSLNATVGSLHPHYWYNITITAVTVAPGPFSSSFVVQTDEDVPDGSPQAFSGYATSPFTAYLTWQPPPLDQQNGIIISYVIHVVVLETGDSFMLFSYTTSLAVSNLKPFRTYICIIAAQTSVGIGPYGNQFILSTPEDAPSGPPLSFAAQNSSITSTGFSLQWSPPDSDYQNGVIDYYVIRVTEMETDNTFEYITNITSFSFFSLHPYYTYQCRVAAFTVGLGPFTVNISIRTWEDVPSRSPDYVSGTSFTSTSILLFWDEPAPQYQNGMITYYILYIIAVNSGNAQLFETYARSYTVNNLKPFTEYDCMVAAGTSVGQGPFSAVFSIKTLEDAPSAAPTFTASSAIDPSAVALQWLAPPVEYQNGIIREYWINVTNSITGTMELVEMGTTVIITSLIPSFTYYFSVAAFTVAVGPYNSPVVITLPESVPSGYPQSIEANATSPFSIVIKWAPPPVDEQNGVIIEYVINVTHTDTLVTTQHFTDMTSITITSLEPYTIYICVVAAETAVGTGPFSHLIFVHTPEAAPVGAPQHPTATALGQTSIHLTWDPPELEDHNGEIQEYRINITEAATGLTFDYVSNITQITITGLHPYYIYHCTIVAVTVDEGPISTTVSAVTDEAAPTDSPQTVTITVLSSTSLIASWQAPALDQQNGIIRQYSVVLLNIASGGKTTLTSFGTSTYINGLKPFTSYSCKVAAFTIALGPYSATVYATTQPDVPSAPPETLNATSIDSNSLIFEWTPPSPETANGIIQYYTMTIFEQETGTTSYYNTTDEYIYLSSFHPYYTYVAEVAAVTIIGSGPTIVLTVQMPEDAPVSAPTSVVASEITSTSFILSWNEIPMADQNGIVREYKINITEVNTGEIVQKLSTTESLALENLHPYYTYSVMVAAYTIESGPYSTSFSFTTAEDVPSSPPTSLTSYVLSSSMAQIFWDPPEPTGQNGIITNYTVIISNTVSGESSTYITTTVSFIFSKLPPFTVHECFIAASTSTGMGPFTSKIAFKTLEDAPTAAPQTLFGSSISSTSISLSWLPPASDSQNGIIRRYEIIVVENDTGTIFSHNSTETSLILSSMHPYYYYQCSVAAYTVGLGPFSDPVIIQTHEDAPSAPPSSVVAIATDANTIFVSWQQPPAEQLNGVIKQYRIIVSVMETMEEMQIQTTNTNLTLTSLHPYYTYTVLVLAFTVAPGPFSIPVTVQTPQKAPSGPPQSVAVISVSSTTMELSWQPPPLDQQNGLIQSYNILVFEVDTNSTQQIHQDFMHNSISLTGLHPYYTYTVSVAAYTVGLGPAAAITMTTEQDAPYAAPKNVSVVIQSSTSVIIRWSPPDANQQNGIIQLYQIRLYNLQNGATVQHNSTIALYTLTGLHPNYNYLVSIAAVTVGVGPEIETEFQMPEEAPTSPPTNLKVTYITSTTAVVNWNPPPDTEQNGDITSYTLHVINTKTNQITFFFTSGTSLSLTSLFPYTVYSTAVSANTSAGMGPYTTYTIFQTPEDAPSSAPQKLTSGLISSTSVTLTWQPPPLDSQNGLIRSYEIIVVETETSITSIYNTTETTITISSLHPYYVYEYRVAAVTDATGPFSDSASVQTLPAAPSGPPTTITVAEIDPETTLFISWSLPLPDQVNGIVQHYIVNVYVHQTQTSTQYTVNTTNLTVPDLEAFYTYTVLVAAFTVGLGPFSDGVTITTSQTAPTTAPQNFAADWITPTSVQLSWEPPPLEDQNGLIQSYTITVFEVNSNTTKEVYQNFVNTTIVLTGLHPYYNYIMSVAAYTVGLGPFASITLQTEQDAPSAAPSGLTVDLVSSTSVTLQWNALDEYDLNGVLQHYGIELENTETGQITTFITAQTIISIDSLHPYYNYVCHVTVVTVSSGPEAITTFQMPEDVPTGSPKDILAIAASSTLMMVTWNPPDLNLQNGFIKYYNVSVTEQQTENVIWLTENTSQITVDGLHPYYYYSVQVALVTIAVGPFSDPVLIQLLESIPSAAPQNFLGEIVSPGTAYMTWTSLPPEFHNGELLGYNVRCTSERGDIAVITSIAGTSLNTSGFFNVSLYECTVCAFTSVGCGPNAFAYISTYEGSPVGPPTAVVISSSTTSVTLQWLPPYDPEGEVESYGITYYLVESSINITTPRPPVTISGINGTQVILEPLLQSSKYSAMVFAVTDTGIGPRSEELTLLTTVPDNSAPQDLVCTAVSSTAIRCTWNLPDLSNYSVIGYELTHKLADGFDFYSSYGEIINRSNLTSETNEITISSLQPYGGYVIELRASTVPALNSIASASGSGDIPTEIDSTLLLEGNITISGTSTAVTTLSEVPALPVEEVSVNVTSTRSVNLTWSPPPRYSWRGVIHYNIIVTETAPTESLTKRQEPSKTDMVFELTQLTNNRDPSLASEPLQAEQFIVTDLEESFTYDFSIQVVNDAGNGDSSAPVMQQMPEDVPSGPPMNITATDITSSSITITWSPPNPREANGVIVGYTVIFTRVNLQDTTEDELDASDRSFTKPGLRPYENISFTIAASTVIGRGPFSEEMFFQSSSEVPSSPQSLQYNLTRDTVVQLSWLPPSTPNGKLTSYQVIYTAHGQSEDEQSRTLDPVVVPVEVSAKPQVVISDLIPGLVYEFKVRAGNMAGYGANASAVVFVPETRTTEPSSAGSTQNYLPITVGVVLGVFVLVLIILVLVVVCLVNHKRSKAKIHSLDTQDELPTIENPLYDDDAEESNFTDGLAQNPKIVKKNEYELVYKEAPQKPSDDVEELKKNLMKDSGDENEDTEDENEDIEISNM